ncbi:putrescine oxidase [Ilyonectria robusta]
MRFSVGILHLLVAGSVASRPPYNEKVVERDVVIIGGGSSGTYAAVRLKEEGKSVVVLEKEDHLGGHTVTYTDPDTHQPFNLGVVVFHDSPIVRNYFATFGVAVNTAGFSALNTAYYDFSTGRAVNGFTPASQQASGAAVQKYAQIIATKYPYLALGYDLPDPVPKELLAPYSEFIEANGLQDMVQLVNSIAGCNGNLLERPTLYGIKVFGLLLIQTLSTGFINAASGDNLDLYRGAQHFLGQNVVYNADVRKIKRSHDSVQVWVNTPKGKILVKAKKLVLAIPPLKEYLQDIGLDMTQEESDLFCKFKGFLYGSAVFEYSGIGTKTAYTNIGTNTPSNLLKLPGSYTINPLVGKVATNKISSYIGGLDPSMTKKEVKQLIEKELGNLAKAGNIGHGKAHFKFYSDHAPYHIHVSANDIKQGFYKKLYALEGKTNTFWTGAAFVDNDSTLIWTWTEAYLLPLISQALK